MSDVASDFDDRSTRASEWNPAIYKRTKPQIVTGLECVGFSGGMKYNYQEPETARSSLFEEFFSVHERSALWWPTSEESWRKEYRPPSLDDIVQHMNRFGGQRKFDEQIFALYVGTAMRRMTAYEGVGSAVRFTNWLTHENLVNVRVPSTTSAGLRWSKLGFKSKLSALAPAIEEASRDMNGLRLGRSYETPPCKVAARGKLVDVGRELGKKEGRLVLVPDLKRHLMGSLASVPYSKLVKSFSKDNGGVMIGMGPFDDWYQHLAQAIQGERKPLFYVCADFSGYDQTVPAPVLAAAMARIRNRFSEEVGSEAYWDSEYEHLVNTVTAMPNGQLYRKERGVSSGDPWTSQAGSEANWLMHEVIFDLLGWDARAWTFGDDVVCAVFKTEREMTHKQVMVQYVGAFEGVFGMEVKMSDSYVTEHLVIDGTSPVEGASVKFLANYFMRRGDFIRPVPAFERVVEGMMYPEHNNFDILESMSKEVLERYLSYELMRTSSYYLTSYYNPMARAMLERYYNWLRAKLDKEPIFSAPDWTQYFKYLDIPTYQPLNWVGRLPTYEEVWDLYKFTPRLTEIERALWGSYGASLQSAEATVLGTTKR